MPKAISLMEELMQDDNFRFDIQEFVVIPSRGGVFEVSMDEQLIFSKKELDRFPRAGEVSAAIRQQRNE
ncbi:SelT/SelW/SelH family protein [Aneurinibacillus terranovensis]|uniref:SelT/SelW/SelH family protein n=1 Tax=Aneurinibacillus terranovensis TaxID=278991 RepID=UPI003CCC1E98